MLLQFLNNNFIQVADDQTLTKLKKASDAIQKKLNKNKSLIIDYGLVAIDPDIPADNEIINEVKEIIIKYWNTFSSNAKDTPIVYIRAVILDALEILANDRINALIIWFSLKNLVTKFNLNDKERELISNFLLGIGNKLEEEAIQKWSTPLDVNLSKFAFELKSINTSAIDSEELHKALREAVIHSGWGLDGQNPHMPHQGNVEWSRFFSQKGSTGIAEVINNAIKQKTKDITANFTHVQEKLNAAVTSIQEELLLRNVLFQIRTNLIWWKEASYSNSLNTSYKSLKDGSIYLAIAKDYSQYIPSVYPVSVEYFLVEALKTISNNSEKNIEISVFLEAITADLITVKKLLKEPESTTNRQTLLSFISGYAHGRYHADQFKSLVGLEPSTEISYSDLTLWLFHDNQVNKIINTK